MVRLNSLLTFACILIALTNGYSQISIVSSQVNPLNISAHSLCQVVVLNQLSTNIESRFEITLNDQGHNNLLTIQTGPIILKPGVNMLNQYPLLFERIEYGSNNQALYVKQNGNLPSGKFIYCIYASITNDLGRADEYCDEIESDLLSFLNLIHPPDRDTIYNPYPVLVWNHNEPFEAISSNQFFKIILCCIDQDQSAESAIISNKPVFIKDFLTSHTIQYPFDAVKLIPGNRYAWQIQKVTSNMVTARSETWEFTLKPDKNIDFVNYAVVKSKLESGFYQPIGNKLYFKFEEEYHSSGSLTYRVLDEMNTPVKLNAQNQKSKVNTDEFPVKSNGDNRYEINLNNYDLRTGFYLLEIRNEKNQTYYIKFLIDL